MTKSSVVLAGLLVLASALPNVAFAASGACCAHCRAYRRVGVVEEFNLRCFGTASMSDYNKVESTCISKRHAAELHGV